MDEAGGAALIEQPAQPRQLHSARPGHPNAVAAAVRRFADIPPITVTVGKFLFHSEAVMLAAQPAEALLPVPDAVREATQEVTGSPGRAGSKLPWNPHITIAYSTARQPAVPIIAALGRSLPERKVQIRSVSLVNQRGPECSWDWHREATIRCGNITVILPGLAAALRRAPAGACCSRARAMSWASTDAGTARRTS